MIFTIYCHTHIESGRRYVGLTKHSMMRRWNRHIYNATRITNINSSRWHFPNAIRKYGKDAFSHEVLEVCIHADVANLAEKCWIEFYDTVNPERGFNSIVGGAHSPNQTRNSWDTKEHRAKFAASSKARWENPEYHAKMSAIISQAAKTRWADSDYRSRHLQLLRDRGKDPEFRAKMASIRSGQSLSLETRQKISAKTSAFNRIRVVSPETRAKINASISATYASRKAARGSKDRGD